ncbi:MAG: glycoside hydrolase family 15 protein [Actinobacteria bacterium]|nr:glycoside hydrolase family 15 protein [Actinomycetota bacterium]
MDRIDGFAPIGAYGVIGDGRVAALVAADGAIDWLCLPDLSGPAVFAALLDPERGGSFELRPRDEFTAQRRYLPDTNVLETTFTTADGVIRVTDVLTLQEGRLLPWVELVRRVEGVSGRVDVAVRVRPRFDFGRLATRWRTERGYPVARGGSTAVSLVTDGDCELRCEGDTLTTTVSCAEGSQRLVCLVGVDDEPLVFPHLDQIGTRIGRTADFWRQRASAMRYDGPYRDAVVRSGLALQLLISQSSGAIAAAATMALPERIGGSANFDYRYQWVRDASFILDAFMGIGFQAQAHASFTALQRATNRTHPRLQPMFRLDGDPRLPDETLDLRGYRDSRPVRIGNGAAGQLQLGNFGDLLDTTWRYTNDGHVLDTSTARRVADVANLVTALWTCDDSGIWELRRSQRPYTSSKMACWLTLDRAITLAEDDHVPKARAEHWRRERDRIHRFVEQHCWSQRRGSYIFYADADDALDASVLLAARMGYPASTDRLEATIDAIRSELGAGPFVYRYSGTQSSEGAFLACSFWLVEALALVDKVEEATELMDQLIGAGSDLGLFSEEIDPTTGTLLGNYPQGLSHLALINAALVLQRA